MAQHLATGGRHETSEVRRDHNSGPWIQAAVAALLLTAVTLIANWLHASLAVVLCAYIAVVVLLSYAAHPAVAIAGAVAASACVAYFFVAPKLSFAVADRFDVLALAVFVGVAVATTTLVARLKTRTRDLQRANAMLAKHSETMLAQAQEFARVNRVMLMGEMAASIAHEINQPLTGILSNAGTSLRYLAAREPDLESARQYLQFIIRDGNRAAEIVRRVRHLVGRTPPIKHSFDLNDAIAEAIVLIQGNLNHHTGQIKFELSPGLPRVVGDRVQLQQAVLNLVLNASEAMDTIDDREGTIVIASGVANRDEVFVEVRDSGPGIKEKDMELLFTPFFTTKPEGMGMGLAISRLIVEAHGGTLSVRANTPTGAVFRFTVPIKDPDL